METTLIEQGVFFIVLHMGRYSTKLGDNADKKSISLVFMEGEKCIHFTQSIQIYASRKHGEGV